MDICKTDTEFNSLLLRVIALNNKDHSFFHQVASLSFDFSYHNGTLENYMQMKKLEVIEMLNR